MKRILVTGGAGFIGSNLCEELLKKGYRVTCLDNFTTGRIENLSGLINTYNNFEVITHDINVKIDLTNIDAIYNLACPASPPKYQLDPFFTLDTSYIGTKNILDLAVKNKAKVLHASTSEIYGNPILHPQAEDYFGNVNIQGPRSCYDEGKRVSETLCYLYKENLNLDVRVVRIFNTYGPKMDPTDGRVISNFINQAIRNEDITIYGLGDQTRSFQYISDLIRGLFQVMELNSTFSGAINLGNPFEYRISQIADIIKKITNSKSNIIFKDLPKDDPERRKPDISKAIKLLNWEPNVNLDEGLLNTIKYYRSIQ